MRLGAILISTRLPPPVGGSDKYGAKALGVLNTPWRHANECVLTFMSAVGAIALCSLVHYAHNTHER